VEEVQGYLKRRKQT